MKAHIWFNDGSGQRHMYGNLCITPTTGARGRYTVQCSTLKSWEVLVRKDVGRMVLSVHATDRSIRIRG